MGSNKFLMDFYRVRRSFIKVGRVVRRGFIKVGWVVRRGFLGCVAGRAGRWCVVVLFFYFFLVKEKLTVMMMMMMMAVHELLGLEPTFWRAVGERNPLEGGRRYHQVSLLRRVWIFKGLCDTVHHTHKTVQEVMQEQHEAPDARETLLGQVNRLHPLHLSIHLPIFPSLYPSLYPSIYPSV